MANRLTVPERLYIRMDDNNKAIQNSAVWRRKKPVIGRWKDITAAVQVCCSLTEPTLNSYILFQYGSGITTADITDISLIGYTWSDSLADLGFLIVPLPFEFAEAITLTIVAEASTKLVTSTISGDGIITETCTDVSAGGNFTISVTDTPGSQYLVIIEDGTC